MMTAEISLTGGRVAEMLIADPEEFYYALQRIIEDAHDDLPKEIAGYASDPEELAQLFDLWAERIRGAI